MQCLLLANQMTLYLNDKRAASVTIFCHAAEFAVNSCHSIRFWGGKADDGMRRRSPSAPPLPEHCRCNRFLRPILLNPFNRIDRHS
jgi:hypothetical protein